MPKFFISFTNASYSSKLFFPFINEYIFVEMYVLTSDIMLPVAVGIIVSAVVGFFAILLFRWMLKKDRMYIFVAYTAVVGLIIAIIGITELNSGVNIFTGKPLVFM